MADSQVHLTLSPHCLKELSAACQKASSTKPHTLYLGRPCAEELWHALMTALKGHTTGGKTPKTNARPKGGSTRSPYTSGKNVGTKPPSGKNIGTKPPSGKNIGTKPPSGKNIG